MIRLLTLAFLIMTGQRIQACSGPHPYAWMDLIVPEIEFKDCHITNVVAFFNAYMVKAVTNKPPPTMTIAPEISEAPPLITFTARYVSIGCSLKIIASVAGMTYAASETGAVFKVMKEEIRKREIGTGYFPGEDPFATPVKR